MKTYVHTILYTNVYKTFIHNIPNLETTQMPINQVNL